jgi:aspartate/methionine/tyrosine aminotransferase
VIAPELEQLLRPLESFEEIRRRAVRLGERLCDLSYANPYEGVEERTRAALRETLDEQRLLDLQYSPFGGHTAIRRAVADALTESHGHLFTFDDVILTPGAMSALHLALRACGEPGSQVVIPVPCWLDYPLYARYLGLEPVLVQLANGDFTLDVDAVSDAITSRTSAVLISHPSNPAGRNYDSQSLSELADALMMAERRVGRTITLLTDEAHRDFTGPGSFRSASAIWPATLIVYSFGKYHFMQGQRIGYVAVSPRHPNRADLSRELVRWVRIAGFCTPTALMQRALPRLLSLRHDYSWVTCWRERFVDTLSAAGYSLAEPDATLFLYVGTPAPYDDMTFVRSLAMAGVLVLPAPLFHHRGHFRLSLTGSERMLERALPILCRHRSL